jgi:hypothetical protein
LNIHSFTAELQISRVLTGAQFKSHEICQVPVIQMLGLLLSAHLRAHTNSEF